MRLLRQQIVEKNATIVSLTEKASASYRKHLEGQEVLAELQSIIEDLRTRCRALEQANDRLTTDLVAAERFAEKLRTGMIGILDQNK